MAVIPTGVERFLLEPELAEQPLVLRPKPDRRRSPRHRIGEAPLLAQATLASPGAGHGDVDPLDEA